MTAVVTLLVWAVWDRRAALAALLFGLLAVVLQTVAIVLLRPAIEAPLKRLAVRWLMGTALRLGGAALWAAAAVLDRVAFPPLPTAVGYLGVLVPLLFLETRFLK
ncbi:MAG: hypothetical protein KatS3mg081_1962 [Gemmatimonadales bacterium]|nr:hypothetical protein HRbin33_01263 [bacterium HR33]GIW52607.1 MAG: hypothetical protein KatS3mg081_1962 [Gemmatimonadales bacterium]